METSWSGTPQASILRLYSTSLSFACCCCCCCCCCRYTIMAVVVVVVTLFTMSWLLWCWIYIISWFFCSLITAVRTSVDFFYFWVKYAVQLLFQLRLIFLCFLFSKWSTSTAEDEWISSWESGVIGRCFDRRSMAKLFGYSFPVSCHVIWRW